MDFRSQLSAFQSGGGGGGGGDSRRGGGGGSDPHDRSSSRSPSRGGGGYSNSGNYQQRDNYSYNKYGNNRDYYGRGGGGDRRRPHDWNSQHQSARGPPQSRRRFHSPERTDRDGLGDLRHHGYRIPRGIPPPPTTEERQRRTKHIALLVICIEDLPYEHIWKAWSETIEAQASGKDDVYISLVCHAKYPRQVKSDWLRQRLLVHPPRSGRGNSYLNPEFLTRKPNWGSVEITQAMLDLLQASLKIGHDTETDMRFAASRFLIRRPLLPLDSEEELPIPPVDQFLYVSETCLPVATAQEFFDTLQDTTVSWVNARHRKDPDTPKNAYENDQFACINRRVPGQYRWKADQWVVLCRNHASKIIEMDRPHIPPRYHLWQSFREINASDEMYIPTSLALLGFLRFAADGEDTQQSRSNSSTDIARDREKNSSGTTTEPELNKYEFVKKRPITYTDWSEGMRNPSTFTKGLVDFQRVARLARAQGCLVARKFALFVSVPGVPKEEQKVTGEMSKDEWTQAVEKLKSDFSTARAIQPTNKSERDPLVSDKDEDNYKRSSEAEESFMGKSQKVDDKVDSREEQDDDEEGENQLE